MARNLLRSTNGVGPVPWVEANVSQWQANMLTFGDIHAKYIIAIQNDETKAEDALLTTYYDAEWVYYKIADYTNDAKWLEAAKAAHNIYGRYITKNNGGIPGNWKFPFGLAERYKREKVSADKTLLDLLTNNGAYGPQSTPLDWMRGTDRSREVAYTIDCLLAQEKVGGGLHKAYLETLVALALNHIYTWYHYPEELCPPFMVALTCHSLIAYEQYFPANFVAETLQFAADMIWNRMVLVDDKGNYTFQYANLTNATYHTNPAPDLNLLIAPLYGYLFKKKGDIVNIWRGNLLFNGGVSGGYLGSSKQFNQSYKLSFDYLRWTNQWPIIS